MSRTRRRSRLWAKLILLSFGLLFALLIGELVARILLPDIRKSGICGEEVQPDLGWQMPSGTCHYTTAEFTDDFTVDERHLVVGDPAPPGARCSILALGDSHTRATGVDGVEAWPNQLQRQLAERVPCKVYNAGVGGYSLGQELLRFRQLQDVLQPDVVVVGFSMATDPFDSRGPARGGFVYFPEFGRRYFEVREGRLFERTELAGRWLGAAPGAPAPKVSNGPPPGILMSIKQWLDTHSRLFSFFKRSRLGAWLAARSGAAGAWPALDYLRPVETADIAADWDLVRLLLERLRDEVRAGGGELLVLLIPYTPQVYDEIWASVDNGELLRMRSIERLQGIAGELGIRTVDSTPALHAEVARSGEWLHYRLDGHPTPAGHRVLAAVAADAVIDLLAPQDHDTTPASARGE